MSDFNHHKWFAAAQSTSVAKLQIVPRITMHLACDNRGQVWVSIFQANSNKAVFSLYLRSLAERLNHEDADWLSNSVLILDGAPYHCAEESRSLMEKLRIPVLMLGPYAYEASVCELYFAAFKTGDINPRHVKTGKGQF